MYQRKQLGKSEAESFCRASLHRHKYIQKMKNLEVNCFLEILQINIVSLFDVHNDAKITRHVCSVFAGWQHEKAGFFKFYDARGSLLTLGRLEILCAASKIFLKNSESVRFVETAN